MELSANPAEATILIVDDNPANLGVLTHALEAHGFRVLVAHRGEVGIQIAQLAQPNLILLDVVLPGIDGFETCRRLKADELTKDTPVLFMTVLTEAAEKVKGFQAGGLDYITKPFQDEEVMARVTTHLRMRQLTHSLQQQNVQLQSTQEALRRANEELELRIEERTAELTRTNALLQKQIDERQRVEEVLAAERNLLRTLIDNLPDYIYVKDTQSRFVLANTAMVSHLGATEPDQVLGKTDFDFFRPDLAAQFFADEQAIVQSGQPLVNQEELNANSQSDAQSWVWTSKVPLRNAQEQIVGLVGVTRDITERRRLEAQFLQAQKMEGIGRLAGAIAHDFNNLLTAIIGYTELVHDMLKPADPIHGDLRAIQGAADRAVALTRQLLAFARKQVLDPQVLDLNDLALNLDKLLRRLIGEDIELVFLPAPDLGYVKVDANQIEQVLINLAINARDAMPSGGKLTIETANVVLDEAYAHRHVSVTPGPYVMLAVSDTGVGMPPEVQARLFEPFFTTKEAGRGTGLGLATCYGIVKQHGGNIWVYSEVGRGTTIKVYLPRTVEAAAARPAQDTTETLLYGAETVLLVEDEEAVRGLAARVLRQLGYTLLEATNGTDALRVASEYREDIDLLLTDVVMPQMGGHVLAERLLNMRPGVKVLFMSGYTDNTIVHHGILEPDIAFLEKPFAPAQLARKVREVLDAGKEAST